MLLDYNKKELEELGRLYGVKGIYKLKKAELIDAILKAIPDNMSRILEMLEVEDLKIFEDLITHDKKLEGDQDVLTYYNLLDVALVELVETRSGAKLVVSPSIKKSYKGLNHAALKEKARANSEIRTHIMGLLNLYGAVELSWVCALYNRYHKEQVAEEDIIQFIRRDRFLLARTKVIDGYLADETVYSIDINNFYDFLELTKDKQYYVPSKEYIEQASDEMYYDNTLYIQKLKSYIRKNFTKDEEDIEDAVLTVVMISRVDCDKSGKCINIILEEWAAMGFELKDLKQANETVNHIVNVVNTTRKWINKGHTPAELRPTPVMERKGAKVRQLDVGRNALCPCGSGKKYKKCCGKIERE